MKLLTLQPSFTVEVPMHDSELMNRVRQVIQSPELRDRVKSAGACIDLSVDASEQRFWSPHLNVQVDAVDGKSHLFCRFSPRPEVWTMVMMIYFITTFIITGASIYGYVQWFLGETPWSLALIPTAALVIIALHVASLIGQGLSADQMDELRCRLDETLRLAVADGDPLGDDSGIVYRLDPAASAAGVKPPNELADRVGERDPNEQLR